MRIFAFLVSLALAVPTVVLAQPVPMGPTREVRALDAGLVSVTTTWSEARGRRAARVTASLGAARPLVLHDGATVRTAIGGERDALLVVAFHGGEHAFVRARLARVVEGGALSAGPTLELSREHAARRPTLRPAAALVATTPDGFTVLVQEQDTRSPDADVVTTMTRIAHDGALIEAPRVVAIPWALGALAWNGRGYHLAVLWGGWGTEHAGTARVCLVTLSEQGAPQEHPWWASTFDALSDVQLARRDDGAMVLVWRRGDALAVMAHVSSAPGRWGAEPAPAIEVARIAPDAPFALQLDGERIVARTE
ncbi:hypothetical protein [Sandaracinus amylolyticus]|uniref:Uncharacterized protein n=1 Tax=Sandaracinus amylolyticus TaxID=927083 RepID=A0A0F6YJQ6_9BACT|nr:hypothetical protein [Sandaracinus amylolyticus]AKF08085.1 hypothetical protein DB32_005234 [Sandaracinus amylolyticus]